MKVKMYLKFRAGFWLMYLAVIGIFWMVLYLYNVETRAFGYAVQLSLFLVLLGEMVSVVRRMRHKRKVEEALKALPHELRELPAPFDETELLYQDYLQKLFACKAHKETDARIAKQEMLEYYNLWAHQIKTPLAAMHLLIQSYEENSWEEQGEEEEEKQFLDSMKMELFKTEQYVEMVMSYLRMGEMSADLSLQWYDLEKIVRQAVKKYSPLFILKNIRLDYQLKQSEKIRVLTDEKWLLLVLEQILSNALKYTESGKISIYMEEDGMLVTEDTGIGIAAEDLPRIFEKGFTGYNGRRDKKSTGIGLYLCKSVCEKLNHTISVESEVGKGTKVRLCLSRERADELWKE